MQFAKEVSETKAMDDALNRLEDMFSGSTTESRDHTPMPRRGTSTLTSGTTPPQKEPPANTVSAMIQVPVMNPICTTTVRLCYTIVCLLYSI